MSLSSIQKKKISKFLKNKNILITGGTGSFGKKLIKYLLNNFSLNKIIIYSRDEQKQFFMANSPDFNSEKYDNLRYFIGDVRDYERLNYAMEDVDIVIHAAALKHVSLAEYNPMEYIKTNINGANNVLKASIANNIKNVVALSTDKAANPINLYGATKLASDKLFIAANNIVGKRNTKFSIVRYGNVMASRGSIIEIFNELKNKKSGIYPVTDKEMTRFFITLNEAVEFVLLSLMRMQGGEIFVPKIPSIKIVDLVSLFNKNAKIKYIGIRPGEKMHEVMCTREDSVYTIEYKYFYLIKPQIKFNKKDINYLKNSLGEEGKKCKIGFEYNSFLNPDYLSGNKLKKIIFN